MIIMIYNYNLITESISMIMREQERTTVCTPHLPPVHLRHNPDLFDLCGPLCDFPLHWKNQSNPEYHRVTEPIIFHEK